jgi:hypothetical protein
MAVLNKKSYNESIKIDIMDTMFGNYHPDCDVQFSDFGIHLNITGRNHGNMYWTKFNKDCPYNDIHISGSNEKGTHFVMDYIPEDFKIYNETGAYMKCELRNDAILKGDICFSNIVLEDYQFLSFTSHDNYLPVQLYQTLKEVTSLDFGVNGGILIKYIKSIYGDDYKSIVFEEFMEKYELFQKHLTHLPYIQLLVNISNEKLVQICMDLVNKDKCYYMP